MKRIENKYLKLLESNVDEIIAEWRGVEKAQEKYNGWSAEASDKIKRLVYDSIALKSGYDLFYKLGLDKYLGEDYTEKLFNILTERNDYCLYMFIFKDSLHDTDTPSLYTLNEVKEDIDNTLNHINFIKNCTYQGFYFSNSIKDVYYQGDTYLGADKLKKEEWVDTVMEICVNKTNDFFPQLIKDLHTVIGDENCSYDFYEFGSSGFMLFWNITTEVYVETMNRVKAWLKYNELENHCAFKIKDPTNNDKVVEIVGDENIIDNYYNN